MACQYGNAQIVKLLLSQPNINVEYRDNYGRTAAEVAKQTQSSSRKAAGGDFDLCASLINKFLLEQGK